MMTTPFAIGAFLSAGFVSAIPVVAADETLTTGQQWTVLAILAAVLGAVWKLLDRIGTRMASSLDKHTETVSANTEKIGTHTEKVGEMVTEMRAMSAQRAMHQREQDRAHHELVAKLKESIDRVPNAVADELKQRNQA
jgi:hypothetical protein